MDPKSQVNTNPVDDKTKTNNKVLENNQVDDYKIREYNTVREYNKVHQYNKIHAYEYREYKPAEEIQLGRTKPKNNTTSNNAKGLVKKEVVENKASTAMNTNQSRKPDLNSNSNEMKQTQSLPKPPTPKPGPPALTAPRSTVVVPIVPAVITHTKKSTLPSYVKEANRDPANLPPKTKSYQYKENPSSWSEVPRPKVNRVTPLSLPPEVLATIEAYAIVHNT